MHISLPTPLRKWVDEQVEAGGFGTASEFMRHLIREARTRSLSHDGIEQRLLEALDEGKPQPLTQTDLEDIRKEGRRRAQARRRTG